MNRFAGIRSQFLDPENIPGLNLVLLAAGFEDRKHVPFLFIAAFCGPRVAGVCGQPATSNSAPLQAEVGAHRGPMITKPGAGYRPGWALIYRAESIVKPGIG
ncbi:hypothetical protein AB9K41_07175 [Cribrihabitans sp. XS_ASV171]